MLSLLNYITSFFTLGATLALVSIHFGFSVGAIGALILLGFGFIMKRYWAKKHTSNGMEPCDCEQALNIQFGAYILLLGHSVTALLHTQIDIRFGQGSSIAIDSWMMIFAAIITEFIFKRDRKITDERDARYSAHAIKWGYLSIILFIVVLALYLALTPPSWRLHMSNFLIGNILISVCLTSYCTYLGARLFCYLNERKLIELESNVDKGESNE